MSTAVPWVRCLRVVDEARMEAGSCCLIACLAKVIVTSPKVPCMTVEGGGDGAPTSHVVPSGPPPTACRTLAAHPQLDTQCCSPLRCVPKGSGNIR